MEHFSVPWTGFCSSLLFNERLITESLKVSFISLVSVEGLIFHKNMYKSFRTKKVTRMLSSQNRLWTKIILICF